jgi:hypothetical protein
MNVRAPILAFSRRIRKPPNVILFLKNPGDADAVTVSNLAKISG